MYVTNISRPRSTKVQNCLVSRFLDRLDANPGDIVARTAGASMTMSELGADARCLAAHIGGSARTNRVVGVFCYPGFELLAGLWGALIAGAAYCPLSPDYPEERLR